MKYLLILISICGALRASAQVDTIMPRDDSGKIHFSQIDTISGTSKSQLYSMASVFLSGYWRSAKDVTQLADREAGILITSGYTDATNKVMGFQHLLKVYYSLRISCRDGRYRAEIYDISVQEYPNRDLPNPIRSPAELIFTNKRYYKSPNKPRPSFVELRNSIESIASRTFQELSESMSKNVISGQEEW